MSARNIIKNLLSLSAAEGIAKIVTFLYTIYLARVIGTDGFGIFGFATAFASYFIMVVNLGFDAYGARETAKDKSRIPFLVNSIMSVRLTLSIVLFTIYLIVVFFIDKPFDVKIILILSGISIFSNVIQVFFVFQGIEEMGMMALRLVISSLLNLLGMVLFVHNPADLTYAMVVIVFSLTFGHFWVLVNYWKRWERVRLVFDLKIWMEIIKGAVPIGLSFFIILIYNNIDMVMLGFMRSNYETGIYNAAHKILLVVLVPGSILQSVFYPNFSKRITPAERQPIMEKYTILTFGCGLFLGGLFSVFAEDIVLTGFSQQYSDAIGLVPWLMITGLMIYISISYSCPLIAWNKEKEVMIALSGGGITNVVFNIFLIPAYGVYGAAYSTIASEMIVWILLAVAFKRFGNKLFINNLLKLSIITAIACTAGYIFKQMGIYFVISAILSVLFFILLNFIFRTISIQELKGYISK